MLNLVGRYVPRPCLREPFCGPPTPKGPDTPSQLCAGMLSPDAACREVMQQHSGSVRLLAYPNLGEGWDAARDAWDGQPDLQPKEFGAAAAEWVACGASLVGGCCRTTPEHINAVAAAVK